MDQNENSNNSIQKKEINNRIIINNTIWKFAERILAQLVSLVVSIILARLLLPNDYGIVSMVIIFITIANVLVTSGIPSSLVQKADADAKDFSSVFFFNVALSIVLYLILFVVAPYIAIFFEMELLTNVLRVLGLQIILNGVKSVIHSFIAKKFLFKKYFLSTLVGTVVSGVVGITMAYNGFGVWSLVAQYLTNSLIDTIILWFTVKWRPTWTFSIKRIWSLLSFGWKMLVEGLANTIIGELRNFIIGKVYTSEDLAFYNKGQQFPKIIVTNISSSISSVLFPAVAAIQDDKERVVALLRKSIRLTSFIVFPILTGLGVVAPQFISVLLTDKWLETVPFLQIACFTFALQIGMIPRHQALNGTGRSDVFMIEHMIARAVGLVLLFLTYKISVLAIALSSIASGLVLTLIVFYTSKKYNGYKIKDQIVDVLPSIIGCVLFAIPVMLLNYSGIAPIPLLFIQVGTGIAIYVIYSIIFKIREFAFCVNFIKKMFHRREERN